MKELTPNASEFLTRKKRAILIASQSSKGPYVQRENKQMGFDNGVIQIVGTRGFDTYLPSPPKSLTPILFGPYPPASYNPPAVSSGILTILSPTSWSFVNTIYPLTIPPISVYSGYIMTLPPISGNYILAFVNASGRALTWTQNGMFANDLFDNNTYVMTGGLFNGHTFTFT